MFVMCLASVMFTSSSSGLLLMPTTCPSYLSLIHIYSDGIMISLPTAERLTSKDMMMVTQMYVQAKPGANIERLGKNLEKAVKPFYTISVLTRDEFKSSMSSMINSMLAIIYALLALSIIIAIFGIVNTLALNRCV